MYVGVGDGTSTIPLFEETLQGWGMKVTYHERLKESYYIVQQLWAEGVDAEQLWRSDEKTAGELAAEAGGLGSAS